MTPELHEKLVKALEIGLDLSSTELANAKHMYAIYPQGWRLVAAEEDVKAINEALAVLGQEYGERING